jgi:hypothetical protein
VIDQCAEVNDQCAEVNDQCAEVIDLPSVDDDHLRR